MTWLYYDPCFLEHDTGPHPENADRLREIVRHLQEQGLDRKCGLPEWQPVGLDRLSQVHSTAYIAQIERFAASGGGMIDADTVVSPRSYRVAMQAAGAVCDAVDRVAAGDDTTALCLVRPPGHHAVAKAAMGFCLFDNIAIGARVATRELDLDRVLIVDWDVHHGNGTQDAFWTDRQVGFLSIHRWPFYPGTGAAVETGSGTGLGATVNLPIEYGTPREEYVARFRAAVEDFADRLRPQLVMISAGFDAHREDPVGSLGLETEDFATLTRIVQDVADTHAGGRVVSVLEGGYNTRALGESVGVHLGELLGDR